MRISILMIGIWLMGLVTSCSNDSNISEVVPLQIDAQVVNANTRLGTSGFSNDASTTIGVFAAGKENVAYTSSDGKNFTGSINFNSENMDVKAYYPYQATLDDGAINLNTESQSDDLDLLYASSTARIAIGKANLTFKHVMSKLTFNFKLGTGYDDTESINSHNVYKVQLSNLITDGSFIPLSGTVTLGTSKGTTSLSLSDYTAEAIVLPQTAKFTLTAKFDGKLFTSVVSTTELQGGSNYSFDVFFSKSGMSISSAEISDWNDVTNDELTIAPPIGDITDLSLVRRYDYALSDGSFVRGNDITDKQKAAIVGIVFWTTSDAGGTQVFPADDVMKTDYPNCKHGLIVSLNNANISESESFGWQHPYSENVNKTDGYADILFTDDDNRKSVFCGYSATKLLRSYNIGNSVSQIYAVNAVDSYTAAPWNTTGWYIGSPMEMILMAKSDASDMDFNTGYTDVPVLKELNTLLNGLSASKNVSYIDGTCYTPFESGNYEQDDWNQLLCVTYVRNSGAESSVSVVNNQTKNAMKSVRPICAF